MNPNRKRTPGIREFILQNITKDQQDTVSRSAKKFGVTRQTVLRHIRRLADQKAIVVKGAGRKRSYELAPIAGVERQFPLTKDLKEDFLWRNYIRPHLQGVAQNVVGICQHGFTEITNNAIEHSQGTTLKITLAYTPISIRMQIHDNGVGIFKKIQSELHLEDPLHVMLELAKGKLTTDPNQHTGEGIFFTSRMFDDFFITSGNLFFAHRDNRDWLLEDTATPVEGTSVLLEISPQSRRTTKEVFDLFASDQDDLSFSRTHVPVTLARYGDENLISRSQARRLLSRFERFKEVILDFRGVESIGQAFADEIFRVFANEHPDVSMTYVSANDQVEKMILRARNHETERSS